MASFSNQNLYKFLQIAIKYGSHCKLVDITIKFITFLISRTNYEHSTTMSHD